MLWKTSEQSVATLWSRSLLARPPFGRTTSLERREASFAHEESGQNIECRRQRQQDAHAQVGRATLHALQVAQVLTGALRERLLREPSSQPKPPHVGGDGAKEFGELSVGHLPRGTRRKLYK